MINVSGEFQRALLNNDKNFVNIINMTLADGTELVIENDRIMESGIKFEDAVGQDNTFSALGSVVINSLTITLNNFYDDFSGYDFTNAVIDRIRTGLVLSETTELINKGEFTVNSASYNGGTIVLTCLDNMHKFDRPYSESTLQYPASLDTIVRDSCSVCDVNLATSSLNFPNKNFVIQTRPTNEATTFREVLSWCATIACCFARCNINGELEIKWFNTAALELSEGDLGGGIFDNESQSVYTTGDTADGGTFNPWNTGDEYDGGSFVYMDGLHIISALYSQNIGVDDIVITKISTEVKTTVDSTTVVQQYSTGTDGYTISIKANEFITVDNAQTIVDYIGQKLIGVRFRRATISHSSDPTIEAGDVAYIYDRKDNKYPILITRTSFSVSSAQTTICGADDPLRNSSVRFSETTKSYVELRKRLKAQQTAFEAAEEELARRIAASQGLYETDVEQQGGGVIHYLHNKPLLADSDIQIVVSSVGVTVTPDGGDTWYGLTVDGQLIASILTVIGINASWINSGQLVIKDPDNNITFFADTVTGVVQINASSFTLKPTGGGTSQTIQQIADESAAGAVTTANTYTNNKVSSEISTLETSIGNQIADLQAQIDGQIVTYYENYVPTTSNLPASGWISAGTESEHEGDIFVNTDNGRSYRWLRTNNVWDWQIIADTDVAAALIAAQNAQATANDKRRIFVAEPEPPYDVGDLWVQGSSGDIMRCQTPKAEGTSYLASDWVRASKYTDDGALASMVIGGRNFVLSTSESRSGTVVAPNSRVQLSRYFLSDYGTSMMRNNVETDYFVISFDYTVTGATPAADKESARIRPWLNTANGHLTSKNVGANESGRYTSIVKLIYDQATYASDFEFVVGLLDTVVGASITINHVQIEKGTKRTEWTVAPEDVDATTAAAQTAANLAQTTAIEASLKTTAKYGTCETAASSKNKAVTLIGFTLYTGARISVYFTYGNTAASPTLNVNNTGAKTIQAYGSELAADSPYNWENNATVDFVYTGTYWRMSDSSALSKLNLFDQSLTQNEVFDRLTNNGTVEGIFLDNNGNLYINGTFIKGNGISANYITTGTLAAARIAANSISVAKLTGTISNSGWNIDLNSGTFTIGTITADKITSGILKSSNNYLQMNLNTGELEFDTYGGINFKNTTTINGSTVTTNMKISEANIKLLLGSTQYGLLDLGARFEDGTRKVVLEANRSDLYLRASVGSHVYAWIGNTSYQLDGSNASDERIKDNIKPSTINALDAVCNIDYYEFDFKETGEHRDVGYIAQQLEKFIPDGVIDVPQYNREDKIDSLKQINDHEVLVYATKAIKELSEKVEEQQKMIDDLMGRLAMLEKLVI